MPEVSVIIPTYNHRDYILETIESVWAQTFKDYEVIVVNDGSPDDTAEVLRLIAEQGHIRYIEQINKGCPAARNRGLAEAKGKFIAFLDDDDIWPADKLEWQVAILRRRYDLGAVSGEVKFGSCLSNLDTCLDSKPKRISFDELFSGNPIVSPGQVLIRQKFLRAIGGFDETIWGADDLDLWFKLCRITKIEIYPKIALIYRKHQANASRDMEKMLINSMKVVEKNLVGISEKGKFELQKRAKEWLFQYAGRRLINQAKQDIRTWHFLIAGRKLGCVFRQLGWFLLKPKMLQSLLRQFVPVRVRHCFIIEKGNHKWP